MLTDLKGCADGITVYEQPLQRPFPAKTDWLLGSHKDMDVQWMNQFMNALFVQLHAGTCKHSLPDLDKDLFVNRPLMVVAFSWKPVYDGMNKKQREERRAKKKEEEIDIEQKWGIELICEKMTRRLLGPPFIQLSTTRFSNEIIISTCA